VNGARRHPAQQSSHTAHPRVAVTLHIRPGETKQQRIRPRLVPQQTGMLCDINKTAEMAARLSITYKLIAITQRWFPPLSLYRAMTVRKYRKLLAKQNIDILSNNGAQQLTCQTF